MAGDRAVGDVHLQGNLLVGQSLGQQVDHLILARGQALNAQLGAAGAELKWVHGVSCCFQVNLCGSACHSRGGHRDGVRALARNLLPEQRSRFLLEVRSSKRQVLAFFREWQVVPL